MLRTLLIRTKPFRYWLDSIFYSNSGAKLKLDSLKERYANRPMLVVGNGPSLNRTPLDEFFGLPAIGMNKIDLLFDRVKWRPDIIVCTNNLVVKQHYRQMLAHGIPCYLSWKSRWFVPKNARSHFRFFLNKTESTFSKNIMEGVGVAGTVTYTALQFAYYVGANPVILFGVDHSFRYEGSPNEIQKRSGIDSNHFDPNYFASGQYWGLPNLRLSELGYQQAREIFENDGREIFDATVGGELRIFEKISLERAKDLCGLDS